jgi:Zn-dependent peptidase ImmA (M78 family)
MNTLKKIFGENSRGSTAEELARSSDRIFVRSQDGISLYTEKATGRQLSAWEAYKTFGLDVLEEAFFEGSAIIVISKEEPSATFKKRREALGLTAEDIRKYLGLQRGIIEDIENPAKRNPIRTLGFVAQYLGLDETKITFHKGLNGDNQLALRLKFLKEEAVKLKPNAVISFNEAAWIIAVEDRLRMWLNKKNGILGSFSPSGEYGGASRPAYKVGYELAWKTREIIGLPLYEPITNLRELCIYKLALPLVQCELNQAIAGATVANNESRGIVVNTKGRNENVWVRRATIAHELGHLLWDPDQKLENIRVDNYEEMDRGWVVEGHDYVEQRANAFAAEFLAPQETVAEKYDKYKGNGNGVRAVMEEFGVSFALARYQIWNGLHRNIGIYDLKADDLEPTDEWKGRESFTADIFPIRDVPVARRGFFSGLVVLAEMRNLISRDTAIEYLRCTNDEYINSKEIIAGLFNL